MRALLCGLLSFVFVTSVFSQAGNPAYPIIFVHGYYSSDETWNTTISSLTSAWGPFGDNYVFHAVLNAYGNQTNMKGNDGILGNGDDDVLVSFNNENNILPNGNLYAINFKNFWNENPSNPLILIRNPGQPMPTDNESDGNEAAIYKQAYALKKAIERVLAATDAAGKVILVCHSMGGLAAREYLQRTDNGASNSPHTWWVDPSQPDGHRIAKLITIGTPHLGTNIRFDLLEYFIGYNPSSEARRDLRWSYNPNGIDGVYLFGGSENDLADLGYHNTDVNCNGLINPNITGINQGPSSYTYNQNMPLPTNVAYTWITSNTPGHLGNGGDIIVDLPRQWLYDSNHNPTPSGRADTILTDKVHIGETWDVQSIARGLDEPDAFEFAYEIKSDVNIVGFITYKQNMNPADTDIFKTSVSLPGTLLVSINGANSGATLLTIYDGRNNPPTPMALQPIGPNQVDLSVSVGPGTYYVRILGTATPDSWLHPYAFRETFTESAPQPPVAAAATNIAQTSFTANWNASTGATSYRLDVATNSSFTSYVSGYQNKTVSGLSDNVTGLTVNTPYWYRVRAVNAIGIPTGNSNIITVTTTQTPPPSPPVATIATNIAQTSFTANWNSSTGATSYRLDVAINSGFTSYVTGYLDKPISGLSDNVTGLTANTSYWYRVRAVNTLGTSGNSNTIIVATSQGSLPSPPVATSATNVTQTIFTANWNASVGAMSYRLDVAINSGFTSYVTGYLDKPISGLSDNVTGLTANTSYWYRVRAVNTFGASGNSNTITATTNAATQIYFIGTSSSPPNGGSTSGGGNYLSGQQATVIATSSSGYTFVNWTENGSQVTTTATYPFYVTGNRNLVANFTSCNYTLDHYSTSAIASATSSAFWVFTMSDCNWTAATTGCNGMITLTNPTGIGNGLVTFDISANTSTSPRVCTITVGGQTFTVTQVGYVAPCSTTPINPSDLTVITYGSNVLLISWRGNSTNVTDFLIERGPSETGPFVVIGSSGNSSSYRDSNVIGGITYYYRVRACCNSNCSNYTNVASQEACTHSIKQTGIIATADTIFEGESVTLTVQGGSLGTGAAWTWRTSQCNSGPLVGTGSSITLAPNSSTVYVVKPEGGNCASGSMNCAVVIITVKQLPVKANIKLLLEGPYNLTADSMSKTLRSSNVLSGRFPSQPIPANAVDSINIEIRNDSLSSAPVRKFRPAWLLTNGTIRDFNDTTKIYLEFDATGGNYFIVVRHRNHLAIMSSALQVLNSTVQSAYDFTIAGSQAYGTNPMKQFLNGKFGMYAGDANQSGIITSADANSVFGQLNGTGYSNNDVNLSGIVTAADANMVFGNLNAASQVPGGSAQVSLPMKSKVLDLKNDGLE